MLLSPSLEKAAEATWPLWYIPPAPAPSLAGAPRHPTSGHKQHEPQHRFAAWEGAPTSATPLQRAQLKRTSQHHQTQVTFTQKCWENTVLEKNTAIKSDTTTRTRGEQQNSQGLPGRPLGSAALFNPGISEGFPRCLSARAQYCNGRLRIAFSCSATTPPA